MLLVRRGDGLPGAGAAEMSATVSSDLLTIDAITPRVCRLSAVAVTFCTAQRAWKGLRAAGAAGVRAQTSQRFAITSGCKTLAIKQAPDSPRPGAISGPWIT